VRRRSIAVLHMIVTSGIAFVPQSGRGEELVVRGCAHQGGGLQDARTPRSSAAGRMSAIES